MTKRSKVRCLFEFQATPNNNLMKKILNKFSMALLAFVVTTSFAIAQNNLMVVGAAGDPGFEVETPLGKLTNFAYGGPDLEWANDGVNYTNSGVEQTGAHSGSSRAYEMSGDDGAYYLTEYTITNGDQITLTWWALASVDPSTGNTNPPEQVVGLITAASSLDAFSITSPLGTPYKSGLSGAWTQYTLNYTANAGDAGKIIGLYFNTTNAYGFVTNSFGAYDDFYLAALPAGSKPSISTEPASQTAFTGAAVTFAVSAVGATGYQWMAGPSSGSGPYTNLLNSGQWSGANTPVLTLSNAAPTNSGDYVVVVSNGSGSVTSTPPANLTVATIIYQESFSSNAVSTIKPLNMSVTNVGWINELCGGFGNDSRLFTGNHGVTYPVSAVYTYNSSQTNCNGAFYFTTATANGGPYDVGNGDGAGPVTNRMAFPGINLATVANLSFTVSVNNGASTAEQAHWAVQLNNGQWYVSTNYFTYSGATAFQSFSFIFTNQASAWNQLTVSGHDVIANGTNVVVGPIAGANLSGYITGAGLVFEWSTSGGNLEFNNYKVLGAIPPSVIPAINSPPVTQTNITGSVATFGVSATTNGVTSGLTYQWLSSPVGLGTFTPLANNSQISGVTTPSLVISNVVNPNNHLDYEVIVSDAAGSVTSTPPATLWINHSAPILLNDTSIYPDTYPGQGGNSWSIHAGNHNVMNFTASFTGDQPITYQWQYTADTNVAPSNIPNATNITYTLSNVGPGTNANGYYRVAASNSQGGPTNSDWVLLTVLPSSTAQIQWSAKVPFTGLTAAQILGGTPGTVLECESFAAVSVTVTNGTNVFTFDDTGASIAGAGYTTWTGQFNGTTGDTNFDTVLGSDSEGFGTMTVNNLVVGNLYSVQVFAFGDNEAPGRVGSLNTTNDTADVSQAFAMGDNDYVVGNFTATNTTQTINLTGGSTYMCCAIVRNVLPPPGLNIVKVGSNLQLTYTNGVLEQTTNLTGPWTTNVSASPYTFNPATNGTKMFYRAAQ
jgi:hypothetical protein